MCNQGSLVGLCKQDYKSLCAAATICASLVNIQTDTHTQRQHFDQLIRKAQPTELKLEKVGEMRYKRAQKLRRSGSVCSVATSSVSSSLSLTRPPRLSCRMSGCYSWGRSFSTQRCYHSHVAGNLQRVAAADGANYVIGTRPSDAVITASDSKLPVNWIMRELGCKLLITKQREFLSYYICAISSSRDINERQLVCWQVIVAHTHLHSAVWS